MKEGIKKVFSIQGIVGWLKSSALLWYLYRYLGDANIWKPEILRRVPVLKHPMFMPGKIVEQMIDEIYEKEMIFLSEINKVWCSELDDDKKYKIGSGLVEAHNMYIDNMAFNIDKIIYKSLGIENEEIQMIDKLFKFQNVHILKETTSNEVIVNQEIAIAKE